MSYEFEKTDDLESVYSILNAVKLKHSEITNYFINQQSLEQVYHQLSREIYHQEQDSEQMSPVQRLMEAIRIFERRSTDMTF